jgi:hypothetical protein
VLFEDGNTAGFGRVSRDDWTYAENTQKLADLLSRHSGGGSARHDLREGATKLIVPSLYFDLPPAPHGSVLLGDAQQLKPDSLNLERAGQKLGSEARRMALATQDRLDFRLSLPNQFQQQPGQ